MDLNGKKGEPRIVMQGSSRLIEDGKFGFTFEMPAGWSLGERDWQEVLIKEDWQTIHVHLYVRARNHSPEDVRDYLSGQMPYVPLRSEGVRTPHVRGYRTEYQWEHDGRVIAYFLIFGDYVLAVYGYGVESHEMETVVGSFRPRSQNGH